jgi:Planctomycete cytochrome C
MNVRRLLVMMIVGGATALMAQDKQPAAADTLTYSDHVAPLIHKFCLPCHSVDNDNSSELILDSYDTMMEGGKHGNPVVAGKADESNLYLKLLSDPPFGRQMPRGKGPKPGEDDIKIIREWILEGAKK